MVQNPKKWWIIICFRWGGAKWEVFKKQPDFLEKSTWYLGALILLILLSLSTSNGNGGSKIT